MSLKDKIEILYQGIIFNAAELGHQQFEEETPCNRVQKFETIIINTLINSQFKQFFLSLRNESSFIF